MEAVGAAASVLAIATAGIQVSLKFIAFADQVGTAPRRIEDVGTDVSVTAGTLQELGEFMNLPTKSSTTIFNPPQVQAIGSSSERCAQIFEQLDKILRKASHQLRDRYNANSRTRVTPQKIKLSKLECMKWPFLQPSMDSLRSDLRDAKASLTLMLQVVNLRYAQKTASLSQDEQEDLKRTIIAMKRQQLASTYSTADGTKGPPASDSDDSISDAPSFTPQITLEAWSVKPNTRSGELEQHILTTQLPVGQDRITKQLRQSPQSYDSLTSVLVDLSSMERDAIEKGVLAAQAHSKAEILSITAKSWTGSHTLFGQVKSRKFSLIVERQLERSKQPRSFARRTGHRSSSPSLEYCRMRHGRHHGPERESKGHEGIRASRRRMQSDIEDDSASDPIDEVTDDVLIKSLLAEYTDYDPKEQSMQSDAASPPPAYKEVNIFTKREPRPY